MEPQNPKDVVRDIARDLSGMAGELAALKADAHQWLVGPEYEALRLRLEATHAAAEAAVVEARRQVRLDAEVVDPARVERQQVPSQGTQRHEVSLDVQNGLFAVLTDTGHLRPRPL